MVSIRFIYFSEAPEQKELTDVVVCCVSVPLPFVGSGEHGFARGWKHGELRFGHNHLPRHGQQPRAPAGDCSRRKVRSLLNSHRMQQIDAAVWTIPFGEF